MLAYFLGAFAGAFFAIFFGCPAGGADFLVAASAAALMAIFFAVTALRLARVLLDFATVFPVPAAPLRNFDRLVVMYSWYFAQARSILRGTVRPIVRNSDRSFGTRSLRSSMFQR